MKQDLSILICLFNSDCLWVPWIQPNELTWICSKLPVQWSPFLVGSMTTHTKPTLKCTWPFEKHLASGIWEKKLSCQVPFILMNAASFVGLDIYDESLIKPNGLIEYSSLVFLKRVQQTDIQAVLTLWVFFGISPRKTKELQSQTSQSLQAKRKYSSLTQHYSSWTQPKTKGHPWIIRQGQWQQEDSKYNVGTAQAYVDDLPDRLLEFPDFLGLLLAISMSFNLFSAWLRCFGGKWASSLSKWLEYLHCSFRTEYFLKKHFLFLAQTFKY